MVTSSTFPEQIDSLVFFQDISIDNKNIFSNYQNLISQKKYIEAAQYIKESGIPYYGADLFNLLEDMYFQLQTYLLDNPKPQLFYLTDDDSKIPDGAFGL